MKLQILALMLAILIGILVLLYLTPKEIGTLKKSDILVDVVNDPIQYGDHSIFIDELFEANDRFDLPNQYAALDLNDDGQVEIFVSAGQHGYIVRADDGELSVLYALDEYEELLEDNGILKSHPYGDVSYWYEYRRFTSDFVEEIVTFSSYDTDGDSEPDEFKFNEELVSREQWRELCYPYLDLRAKEFEWYPYSN